MSIVHEWSVPEGILLLALRDREGTIKAGGLYAFALGGAVLAELLLAGRVRVEEKKQLVALADSRPLGDPLLDEALGRIASAKRRASVRAWLTRFARTRHLRERIAERLVAKGVLRADEGTLLRVFHRKIYPEIDPVPERELIGRLRQAVMGDAPAIEPRTAVLLALARNAEVLPAVFSKDELKQRKARIRQIADGELIGKAAAEAIEATRVAIFVAAVMPAVVAGGHH